MVLAACLAVVVACLASLAVLALLSSRDDDTASGDPDGGDAATREVLISQVSQFVLRINTYGPQLLDEQNRMPEYLEGVSELMTSRFAAGFEESVVIPEQQVAQSGYGRAAEVYAVGVASQSAEQATVLVAFGRTDSYPDPEDPEQRVAVPEDPERWQVELLLVEGTWLVDDYTVVPELIDGAPSGQPSGQPEPGQPEPGPTTPAPGEEDAS